jgi:hypothetical protein
MKVGMKNGHDVDVKLLAGAPLGRWMAKTAKSRGATPGVTNCVAEAETQPPGARIQGDHVEVEFGSKAACAARQCLNVLDKKNKLLGWL